MTDHDANVFNPPSTHTMARVDHWIEILLSGLTNWDAVYFLHIAEFGYSYENTLAFFPLFPLTVYIVSNTVLMPLQFVMNYRSVIMISAFLLNMLFFVLAARSLYKLSLLVLKDKSLAYRAAQLFCINPASIFFTAAYSEPIYAFLAFTGMFVVESGDNINGSLWFGFSALARSNGLVNFGFVLYKDFHNFICDLSAVIKGSYEDANTQLLSGIFSKTYQRLLSTLLSLCLCCIPFFLYQYYSYTVFCNTTASYKDLKNHVLNYGNTMSYKMAHAGLSPWCFQTVPISYSYIQNTHWNVGFLKYYELKQIPNFLLATPAVLIILFAFLAYFGRHPVYVLSQGIIKPCKEAETDKKTDLPASSCRCGFYSLRTHSYIVHVMALVVFGALFMHVQVITRFVCSSSPVMYWFVAHLTCKPENQTTGPENRSPLLNHYDVDGKPNMVEETSFHSTLNVEPTDYSADPTEEYFDWDNSSKVSKLIFLYFHLYFFVGTAAFSNFLPWT